eukprot:scaffold2842_cov123-Skeletonema_marinoi.AAC.6
MKEKVVSEKVCAGEWRSKKRPQFIKHKAGSKDMDYLCGQCYCVMEPRLLQTAKVFKLLLPTDGEAELMEL